ELERAHPTNLGEEPHSEERQQDEEPLLHVEELVLPEPALELHAAHHHEEAQVGGEVVPREHEEHARERVEEEGGEVELELLGGEGEDGHGRASAPSRTRRRNICSRSGVSWRSSRIVQPCAAIAAPAARAASPSPAASSTNASPSRITRSTPGRA